MAISTPTTTDINRLSAVANSEARPESQHGREYYASDVKGGGADEGTGTERDSKDADLTAERTTSVASSISDAIAHPEAHGEPAVVDIAAEREVKRGWFAYIKTRDFWVVLVLGQVLSLCLTGTNTFSSLLANEGTSIPAFQTLFNYVILALIYTSYTIYRYGLMGWLKLLWKSGWKYFILSFCDVMGNYFTVLAYRYTTILSAELINFWAIAVVVIVSFVFLKVRYHPLQITGILVCIGGLGILFGSDYLQGNDSTSVDRGDQIKGDLFALLGATFYGASNIFEEFLVSKRPLYEVVGMLGFFGIFINGVTAAIFDRGSFQSAVWTPAVGGYLTGYTIALLIFYTLGPLVFRMGSAAFFNISLLTSNFWGAVIGIHVFGLVIHFMYPIAFVCIVFGLVVYFIGKQVYGEAFKPWLGRMQERGISGIGTARRRAERPEAIV